MLLPFCTTQYFSPIVRVLTTYSCRGGARLLPNITTPAPPVTQVSYVSVPFPAVPSGVGHDAMGHPGTVPIRTKC